jgi:hypothetical protein
LSTFTLTSGRPATSAATGSPVIGDATFGTAVVVVVGPGVVVVVGFAAGDFDEHAPASKTATTSPATTLLGARTDARA